MDSFKDFMKRPRNVYFSIVVMLVVVTGLVSISFSYYIDDSMNGNQYVQLSEIDNKIQSDDLTSNVITVPAKTNKIITINVISNNDFASAFRLYYTTDGNNTLVASREPINDSIDARDVLTYNIDFVNNGNQDTTITLGIVNGYIGSTINTPGTIIQ